MFHEHLKPCSKVVTFKWIVLIAPHHPCITKLKMPKDRSPTQFNYSTVKRTFFFYHLLIPGSGDTASSSSPCIFITKIKVAHSCLFYVHLHNVGCWLCLLNFISVFWYSQRIGELMKRTSIRNVFSALIILSCVLTAVQTIKEMCCSFFF